LESQPQKRRRYLEFEKPLQDLDAQIQQLKNLRLQGSVDVSSEIRALEAKSGELLESVCNSLTPYQIVQLARHPDRPTQFLFQDFVEFHGDRTFMDDSSIVGGIGGLDGVSCMILAHQKGRSTQENMQRNFGMPRPEGYRKAMRLMELAERFRLPLICLIDTPGAYPGIEAEERGQAQAIAESILKLTDLKTPIISVILGEGGSGGALALAVADKLLMLQYSIYSVISPEGCAAITWKDGAYASQAAEALRLTAKEILKAKVADRIVPEPLGGAHRDVYHAATQLKSAIQEELKSLSNQRLEDLIQKRFEKFRVLGPVAQQGSTQQRIEAGK